MLFRSFIFDKGGKHIQWRKDSLFNRWCWENWTPTYKRMKLEHSLTPYTKIYSQWIKDLNVRPDTIKLFKENVGRKLLDINCSKIFFDPPQRVIKIKIKINKRNLIKLKSFCMAKGNHQQNKKKTLGSKYELPKHNSLGIFNNIGLIFNLVHKARPICG